MNNQLPLTDEELLIECRDNFYLVATIQGRLAYLLMSIHAVNPLICARLMVYNPTPILFSNMVYGMTVHLFSRPHMTLVGVVHRSAFSILGSMMFNYSSIFFFNWLSKSIPDRPYLLTFLGFLGGRILMVHFLAYLYHIDTRSIVGSTLRHDAAYETMYQ